MTDIHFGDSSFNFDHKKYIRQYRPDGRVLYKIIEEKTNHPSLIVVDTKNRVVTRQWPDGVVGKERFAAIEWGPGERKVYPFVERKQKKAKKRVKRCKCK